MINTPRPVLVVDDSDSVREIIRKDLCSSYRHGLPAGISLCTEFNSSRVTHQPSGTKVWLISNYYSAKENFLDERAAYEGIPYGIPGLIFLDWHLNDHNWRQDSGVDLALIALNSATVLQDTPIYCIGRDADDMKTEVLKAYTGNREAAEKRLIAIGKDFDRISRTISAYLMAQPKAP